jgi:hypothetical protein
LRSAIQWQRCQWLPTSLHPSHQHVAIFATVFCQLAVVSRGYLSRKLSAAVDRHTMHTSSRWSQGPPAQPPEVLRSIRYSCCGSCPGREMCFLYAVSCHCIIGFPPPSAYRFLPASLLCPSPCNQWFIYHPLLTIHDPANPE